jgi:beta-galactosidase
MPKNPTRSPRPPFVVRPGEFQLHGQPFQIICGELHYPRIPRPYWRHRIRMAKAMGLNTVCAYLFWNFHEQVEGKFDFSGDRDAAAFVRLCQEEGMYVLLRPGPYSCAEWDFGGLPWWLLKDPDLRVRCSYPPFLKAAERFLLRVGKELAPLQVTKGGPILMVQVENEYGAFGNDRAYMNALAATLRKAGFDVPLFRCDWANPQQLVPGAVDGDVVTVANFGSDPQKNITALAEAYPRSPKMCGEFWMGWFDQWGFPRQGKDRADGLAHAEDLKWMLANKVSFSLYMFHGGTNFGFSSGANLYDRYDPYVTSYDYWAPLTEQGRPREKFHLFRDIIQTATGVVPPPVPDVLPVRAIPRFELTRSAPLIGFLGKGTPSVAPRPMEHYGQPYGAILYRTDLRGRAAGQAKLTVTDVHDVAWVFLNGQRLGTLDRRLKEDSLTITLPDNGPAVLDILVESMGRVNFGPKMIDRKGITDRVTLGILTLSNWTVHSFPLDAKHLKSLTFTNKNPTSQPAFFRGTFNTPDPADTHLDLRGWGKGYLWINGRLLGRFWEIGPQQTLYVPGCWLKKGKNEVIVLDLVNPGQRSLEGLTDPVLDNVTRPHPEAK